MNRRAALLALASTVPLVSLEGLAQSGLLRLLQAGSDVTAGAVATLAVPSSRPT